VLRVLGTCPNPQTLQDAPEGLRQERDEVGGRAGFAEDGDEEERRGWVEVNVPELPVSWKEYWLSLVHADLVAFNAFSDNLLCITAILLDLQEFSNFHI
jgi:hypothetical protein